MTLIELAIDSYNRSVPEAEQQAAEMAESAREEFLAYAKGSAKRSLGDAAAELDWKYTPAAELPEQVEQATAFLVPGGPEYLRYRADHSEDKHRLELVQPCAGCGRDRIESVHSLPDLGRLLSGSGEA
ncbi:hypothetical protein ACFRDV_22390 [Streptomyces fagopyri]|uniref:hypothetical protein n=1 Tax=Streptomyces fagopyri TaxID=2662397 RepID=UPI0036753B89